MVVIWAPRFALLVIGWFIVWMVHRSARRYRANRLLLWAALAVINDYRDRIRETRPFRDVREATVMNELINAARKV